MATAHQVRRDEARVAVLVDCENVPPEILEHAVRIAAQFGRVVIRRGYGNHAVLSHRWQDSLVRLAFTPCLQFQYASGKNTADIALALDALEVLFDGRADHFCLVTSDSDGTAEPKEGAKSTVVKRRPRSVVEAVTLLAGDTSEGKVDLGNLGNYLRRADPGFSPQNYGHSGLLEMLKTYDLLVTIREPGGHWSVRLAVSAEHSANSGS